MFIHSINDQKLAISFRITEEVCPFCGYDVNIPLTFKSCPFKCLHFLIHWTCLIVPKDSVNYLLHHGSVLVFRSNPLKKKSNWVLRLKNQNNQPIILPPIPIWIFWDERRTRIQHFYHLYFSEIPQVQFS